MEADLDEEVRFHFEQQVEKNLRQGMSAQEARRRARLEFGGIDEVKEECRDARGIDFIETISQDIRYAVRSLRRQPGLVAAATLSAALGIGVCSLTFSAVNFALWMPLRVEEPENLTAIYAHAKGHVSNTISKSELEEIRETESFASVAHYVGASQGSLGPKGGVRLALGAIVSGNFFDVVRPRFVLGQGFVADEDNVPGAPPKAILTYSAWRDRFGGNEALLGKDIRINGVPMTLVGVTAPGFTGTTRPFVIDFYLPLSQLSVAMGDQAARFDDDEQPNFFSIGRLTPGTTAAQATTELNLLGAGLVARFPDRYDSLTFSVAPAGRFHNEFQEKSSLLFWLAMAVAVLVLLTACANVANLLLARAAGRGMEISTRLALGAGRTRIVRQLLTESVLLAAAGGLLGILMAAWLRRLVTSFDQLNGLSVDLVLPIDHRVVAFTVVLCAATGIVFGLAPALRSTRAGIYHGLRSNDGSAIVGLRRMGLRNGLATVQIALSAALLLCAGMFLRSFDAMSSVLGTGTEDSRVALVGFRPALTGYDIDGSKSLVDRVLRETAALPGVLAVSVAQGMAPRPPAMRARSF